MKITETQTKTRKRLYHHPFNF